MGCREVPLWLWGSVMATEPHPLHLHIFSGVDAQLSKIKAKKSIWMEVRAEPAARRNPTEISPAQGGTASMKHHKRC